MKWVGALALVLGIPPPTVLAQAIDIAWGDLGPGCSAGERYGIYGCSGTAAANHPILVTSFVSPVELEAFVGMSVNLKLEADAMTLPDWWRMGAGECRSNGWGAVASPSSSGLSECADPWGTGAFLGCVTHLSGDGGADRARIVADLATDIPQQVRAGTRYYGEAITLTMLRSTGAGACAGCNTGACVTLESIELYQVVGSQGGDVITLRNNPGARGAPFLSWQGPVENAEGCANSGSTRQSSWGKVKTLYR